MVQDLKLISLSESQKYFTCGTLLYHESQRFLPKSEVFSSQVLERA